MTRILDIASAPVPRGGQCANAETRPITAVPTSEPVLNRRDASLIRRLEAGLLKALGLYRELVDVEIGRASEHGARWWSRRLVEMYEDAGLVRLNSRI